MVRVRACITQVRLAFVSGSVSVTRSFPLGRVGCISVAGEAKVLALFIILTSHIVLIELAYEEFGGRLGTLSLLLSKQVGLPY